MSGPPFQPRIAIVGGGPAGLALGLLLHHRGIPATVYERRNKPTAESLAPPSGMLDLHAESGQAVLRECGLWDAFQAALGDCSEATRVLDSRGAILYTDEGELASRPEIPRNALTQLLLQEMPPNTVRWGHRVTAAETSRNAATGAVEITLTLGPEHGRATHDLVVGADGAWSRVRSLLLPDAAAPAYSGANMLTATVRHASANYPHLVELCGSGTVMALGGGHVITTHRGPQDSICVYAAVRTPDEHWAATRGLAGTTAAEVKDVLLADVGLFGAWSAPLRELVGVACDEETRDNADGAADLKPLYMLPVGHNWAHRVAVTLLGDAAHLMTPWAGEGVNLALWDALDLAGALSDEAVSGGNHAGAAEWQAALDPRLREFEEAMLRRAAEKAELTARNKDLMLSENGAQALADLFSSFGGAAPPGAPPEGEGSN
ncbi:hypothetical protein B0T24DRAFT_636017 [Lasiosphaeria ovina]|uniref:FAD-binding domain-containing protein n=1 Tax=Lasiosphaeria ovina TaxID=92902 RepID=A0AAE0JW76_9PEZI|nr:hypothetical protein B0T24DRAFT_636017 [Lasiosphaeria ovina]